MYSFVSGFCVGGGVGGGGGGDGVGVGGGGVGGSSWDILRLKKVNPNPTLIEIDMEIEN